MVRVLFLCLGNICRSPMAEAVFRNMVMEHGLEAQFEIDSAGLGDWHAGERPHQGTIEILDRHGIPHDWMRSRKILREDIAGFDYIVAMDEKNVEGLKRLGATDSKQMFRLMDIVGECSVKNVPDPWYTGNFDEVFQLVNAGCESLLQKIAQERGLPFNSTDI